MGRLFEFGCDKCGYQAEVSGGDDAGFIVITQTMTCLDCKEVVDVEVSPFYPDSEINRADFGRCPLCRGHQVFPWPKSRPCPKWGETMKKLDTGRVCFWD